MKYLDLIAYPIMYLIVYMLMGILNWNRDPETWSYAARVIWIIWGTVWGYALQYRLHQDFKKKEHDQCLSTSNSSPIPNSTN